MVGKQRVFSAGFVAVMGKGRVPNHGMFGEIEDVAGVTIFNEKRKRLDLLYCGRQDEVPYQKGCMDNNSGGGGGRTFRECRGGGETNTWGWDRNDDEAAATRYVKATSH